MSRVIAIDFGDRRIGIALSDPMRIIASPHDVIDRKITPDYLFELNKIITQNDVKEIIVGVPLNMKGEQTPQTKKTNNFVNELKDNFTIPIILVDERLSSISAKKILREKGVKSGHNKGEVDKIAASMILQEFLDSN